MESNDQRRSQTTSSGIDESFPRFVFDTTFQFIGLLEPDGTLVEANQTALDFGGLTRSDVIGKPFWECRWWTLSAETQRRLRDSIQAAAQGEFVRYEVDVRGAGDHVATIDFSLKPVFGADGGVIKIIPEGRDVTEIREAQQAQSYLYSLIQAIFDDSRDLLVALDTDSRIIAFNNRFHRFFRQTYQIEIQTGANLIELLADYPYASADAKSLWGRALAGEEFAIERDFLGPDGEQRYYDISFRRIVDADARQIGAVQSAYDVTERVTNQEILEQLNYDLEARVSQRTAALALSNLHLREELAERQRVEKALSQSEERLRLLNESLEAQVQERTRQVQLLSRSLTLAEQRERRRFSYRLHEDLQQLLFALDMKSYLLQHLKDDPQRFVQEVNDVRVLTKEAIQLTRTLAIELNPPVLRGDGLRAALGWLARHMEEQYGLHVDLRVESDVQIRGEERRILLVQIVRELLFNIVKYAGVDVARVDISVDGGRVQIQVQDEGQGFDPADIMSVPAHVDTFSLYSIEERLKLFDGDFHIDSAPGAGTHIRMSVPFLENS
ncbi:MAG: PAS domain-containing protein [Caldilineaceae bacterium]|nr:PAS domain-containing protein [Caldilineaceae bacterium]